MIAIALLINLIATFGLAYFSWKKFDFEIFLFGALSAWNVLILFFGYFKWFSRESLELLGRADSLIKRQQSIIKKLWKIRRKR